MGNIAIEFVDVGKLYRLGQVGTGTLSNDLNRWWKTRVLGREDPYLKVGETNDRSRKGNSDFVWALQDINLDVMEGEVVGIIGRNGAGKSTLLKLLSMVTAPTTGEIRVHGRIASLLEVGTGFHQEMTGRENIYMNGSIMGMTRAEINSKLDAIVDFAGVERYLDTPVKRYSSGMIVRLGFAVAAFLEPEMLFVSHNMAAVRSLCSRGVVLDQGRMVFDGGVEDAVEYYVSGSMMPEEGLIVDSISYKKDYRDISEILVNGTHSNHTVLQLGQEFLDIVIRGTTRESMKCEVKFIIRKLDGTPMAALIEGRYTGKLIDIAPGPFEIVKHIRLPKYLATGNYLVDLFLHQPIIQDFFIAKNCLSLLVEGYYEPFASPMVLNDEGFIGLQSE